MPKQLFYNFGMENPLKQAIKICGGQTALAREIGLSQPYIYNWLTRSNGVPPPEYCAAIELATDGQVTRKDFYPSDWARIWPELADKAAA